MITLNQPPLTQFISVPKDMSQLSCEAYTAGIVEGVLDGLDVVGSIISYCMGSSSIHRSHSLPASPHIPCPPMRSPSGQSS